MIAYTLQVAQASALLTNCIVSTDDDEIAEVAKIYGGKVPFMRPAALAQHDTPHMPVVQHALRWLKENQKASYDYVMTLQPTSPLRSAEDIDECIKIAVDSNADSVMSMVELVDFDPSKIKLITKNNLIKPLFTDEGRQSLSRQKGVKAYKRNCAVYLTKTSLIMQGDSFGKTSRAYIMPANRSIDINVPYDLEVAEFLLTRLLKY